MQDPAPASVRISWETLLECSAPARGRRGRAEHTRGGGEVAAMSSAPEAAPGAAGLTRGGSGWTRALPPALALAAVAAFLPVLGQGFVFWDDDENFLDNPHFGGLGGATLR